MSRILIVLALLGAPAALAGSADPGVGSSSILVGGTAPLSGEASAAGAVSRGAAAYFAYVNARGGVSGRKIDYKVLDDGYDPSRAVEAVRELVQQDHVFAVFNSLGTSTNLAVRDFLNQSKVPQLFVASSATTWGRDSRRHPWSIGYIPSYQTEGIVLARNVLKTKPRAKIAVLYQDDEYGNDLLGGFTRGLGGKKAQLARAVGYDPTAPDVNSQVAELRATKATVFMIFAFGKFAIQAELQAAKLGWRPQVYVNSVASSSSLMTLAGLVGAGRSSKARSRSSSSRIPPTRAGRRTPGSHSSRGSCVRRARTTCATATTSPAWRRRSRSWTRSARRVRTRPARG